MAVSVASPEAERDALAAMALRWLGTPWRHQARTKGLGADCIGLVGGVGVDMGYASARAWDMDAAMHNYSITPDDGRMLAGLRKYLSPIDVSAVRIADILVFKWNKHPAHFAIVTQLNPMRIVHSYRSVRKVAETGIDGEWRAGISWRSLIVSAWRYRELSA